jgi:uncharacterized ferritin-like protein (DUF455 family)
MMISYSEFARKILEGEDLEDKLLEGSIEFDEYAEYSLPQLPGRRRKISFSDKQLKFPKAPQLHLEDKKAIALHSFANHELLAIEMMAAALLIYPHGTDEDIRFKRGVLSALKDEQKHLGLYIKRLNELGYEFGDFPLNDFFWRQMEKLRTPAEYLSVMALTFEAANLDFAQYYAKIFTELGDKTTAGILETVLEDEISHVALGAHWMKKWREDRTLWEYYLENLPWPLTPARSKGISYDPDLHLKAIGDEGFLNSKNNFSDEFRITKRTI